MRQVVDATGKTYTLVSWLPSVRVTGKPRPSATLGEDAVTMGLAGFTLFALFLDGLRHNNLVGIDNFWSLAHILMYTGLTGLGVWIAIMLVRYQQGGVPDLSLVPKGYWLAIVALPIAAIAGPADFTWHSKYGFENQIDSAYSPPHQALFIAGALLATIPLASAWRRSDVAPSLKQFLPAAFSMTALSSVALFIIHQLVPFYAGVSTTSAFQRDIATRQDAFAPGTHAHHIEGLSRAIAHYGDAAFPYYFYSTHHTVAGILLFTAVVMAALLLMRRRWRLPIGTVTIMFTTMGLLFAMLSEYREAGLIPALVVAGVIADWLLFRLTGGPAPVPTWRIRLFGALVPIALWGLFFLCVALFRGGLGWGATLWVGVICTSALLGFAISFLVFAPPSPVTAEMPAPEAVAAAAPEPIPVAGASA